MRKLTAEELILVGGGGGCTCDCNGGGGNGRGPRGNNGWGNGEDDSPGMSGEHQPKFDDPNTGPSPSNSPASGDGNR